MIRKEAVAMPTLETALPGRNEPMALSEKHYVSGHSMMAPFPENTAMLMFGLGCFWGAERKLWQQEGVYVTAVGYAGGFTPNPTYEEVCTGHTGHTEVVLVIYENRPEVLSQLLQVFWESHDPTQGMRQGNDIGTQYRSAIYTYDDDQQAIATESAKAYQEALNASGFQAISTEICRAGEFYYAEGYHQQYLAKNPNGYCGIGGTGVCFLK